MWAARLLTITSVPGWATLEPDSVHSRVAAGGVEPKRPCDAPQFDRTDLEEGHGCSVRRVDDLLAHHDLTGPGVIGYPRRQVDGTAEVVTLLENHRPRVESDPGRRQIVTGDALDHVEGREYGITGFSEIEHHPVAEPLHRSPPMFLGGPSD